MSTSNIKSLVKNVIASQLRSQEDLRIGMEVENFVYTQEMNRIPVNPGSNFSTSDLKACLEDKNSEKGIAPTLTIEPGGQIEYASEPHGSLYDLASEWKVYLSNLINVAEEENLVVSDLALEPVVPPDHITIIDHRKYKLMHKRFNETGSHGHEMMFNTASAQINLDYTSLEDAEKLAFVSDCLHPFIALIFANTPFYRGAPAGRNNMREIIWQNTDPSRSNCLFDHGITSTDGLLEKFVSYVLNTPTLFTLEKDGSFGTYEGTIGDWLGSLDDRGTLESKYVRTALHQIFTQVRFKHILEIRGPDRPPFGHELAPAAFFQGILRSPDTLEKVMEICAKWSSGDRNQLNELAQTIDLSCEVAGQTLQAWCEQFLSFALEGLTESREKKFLEPFAEKFLATGPFSLSIQASFEKSGKSVEQFLKDRWEEQKDLLGEGIKQ